MSPGAVSSLVWFSTAAVSSRKVNVAATTAEGKSVRGRLGAKRETNGSSMCGRAHKRGWRKE